jgi:hypothetical protein
MHICYYHIVKRDCLNLRTACLHLMLHSEQCLAMSKHINAARIPTQMGPIQKSWSLSPETEINSLYWAYLSSCHVKMETESSPRNVVFSNRRQNDG